MKHLAGAAIVLALTAFSSSAEAQVTVTDFLKQCDQKTIVFGRDEKGAPVRVGEKLGGYCQGVLQTAYALLLRTQAICSKDQPPSPDFLLSAVTTYKASVAQPGDDATTLIEAAYKRAFNCADAKR